MVTIRDVAKESGFSSTTVSIVLNNAPLARYIPAVTKKRIERAAQKLGYRPNQFARSLRSKRSHTVGVMVFDMTDPYCTLVLRGIENTLYQSSYLPILTDVHNERSRFERYLEMLLDRRIEALIVLANWLFLDINLLGDLEKSSIPTAMIGCELKTDSISSVIVDNEVGGYLALEHLHSLGHRKIAIHSRAQGPDRQFAALARHSQFRQSMRPGTRSAPDRGSAGIARSDVELRSRVQADRRTDPAEASLHRAAGLRRHERVRGDPGAEQGWHPRSRPVLGHRLRRRCHLGALHAVAHHGAPAHGSHGSFGGRHRGRRHQRGAGKARNCSASHRKVAPELVVRESTRSLSSV